MKIKNFLFHRVSPENDIMWPPIHPSHFERIIRFLLENYHVVLLETLLEMPLLENIKKPVATVSFDDGYKDNLEFAAPILRKYNCPASFYVVTECINEGIPTWTYLVDYFFRTYPQQALILDHDFVPMNFRISKWDSAGQGKELAFRIKTWLKSISNDQRIVIIGEIKTKMNGIEFPQNLMMNWENVRQLNNAGFYIGSHSHSHPVLASITKEEQIKEELQQSFDIINKQLGYSPLTISYPIGSWDKRVVRLAKEAGYQLGLIVGQKHFDTVQDNKLLIPRVELYSESWWRTRLRINGVYQSARKLFR